MVHKILNSTATEKRRHCDNTHPYGTHTHPPISHNPNPNPPISPPILIPAIKTVHDLARVNARGATSILVMMTEEDRRESMNEEKGRGSVVANGATIRTLLALRFVLCASAAAVAASASAAAAAAAASSSSSSSSSSSISIGHTAISSSYSLAAPGSVEGSKFNKQRAHAASNTPNNAGSGGGGGGGGGDDDAPSNGTMANSSSSAAVVSSSPLDERQVRLVIQMHSGDASFLDAACFRSPQGRLLVETLEVNRFVNSLLFHCAARPGLSSVFLDVLNLELSSIRARPVGELKAGPFPAQAVGWMVGMRFRDACAGCCWSSAILIGISTKSVSSTNSTLTFWQRR